MRLRVSGEEVTETVLHEAAGPLRIDYGGCAPASERVDAGLSPKIDALGGGGEGIQLSEAGPSTMGPVLAEGERVLFSGF